MHLALKMQIPQQTRVKKQGKSKFLGDNMKLKKFKQNPEFRKSYESTLDEIAYLLDKEMGKNTASSGKR